MAPVDHPTPTPVPPPEQRQVVVDPRTVTGTWHIVQGRYGRRAGDKPWWWVAVYHLVAKPLALAFTLLLYVFVAWVARRCGVNLPTPGGP